MLKYAVFSIFLRNAPASEGLRIRNPHEADLKNTPSSAKSWIITAHVQESYSTSEGKGWNPRIFATIKGLKIYVKLGEDVKKLANAQCREIFNSELIVTPLQSFSSEGRVIMVRQFYDEKVHHEKILVWSAYKECWAYKNNCFTRCQ